MATVAERIELLHNNLAHVEAMGGEKKVEKQHAKGKLTARERLALLFDEGSFVEVNALVKSRCYNFGQEKKDLPGEGVVTGYGTVDGRLVFAFAQDFTVEGGSLGEMHAAKIVHVNELALKVGAPCVGLNDFRRSPYPGSSRCSFRLWQDFLVQYHCIRRYSSDFRNYGTVCRRRIFSGTDRLHLHGKRHLSDVPDRTGSS